MNDFGVTLEIKELFFDAKKVVDGMDRANLRALSRVGAFIRTTAIRSQRRRKSASAPGKPPSVHSHDKFATLRNVLFGLDRHSQTLVVGPVRLNQREESWIDLGPTTVPQLHEFGDVALIREWSWDGGETWSRRDKRVRHTSRHRKAVYHFIERVRRARYKPRPFMGPALEKNRNEIPDAWSGSFG